jgi:4'-phosphopantetheinyl transferase EntD
VIEEILPDAVVAVEARGDRVDAALFPEEEQALGQAADKRRREFTTARACARTALERLGLPPAPIPSGPHGEPRWPAGVTGSITHCRGYRACALARTSEVVTVGIDAEPDKPLPDGLIDDIARPEERPPLEILACNAPGVHWDRLLFSAKESVYKAWFPLTGRWLGFEDAVVSIDPRAQTFAARLLVPGPAVGGRPQGEFHGRWLIRDGLVVTAIAQRGG